MCELLGMSASVPTDICFSFSGLIRRSKATGVHKDGWGVAFYEDKGVRLFLEPYTALDSKLAQLVKSYPSSQLWEDFIGQYSSFCPRALGTKLGICS